MQPIFVVILLGLAVTCSAAVSGPYLFWGLESVANVQPRTMIAASKQDLINVYKEAKVILVFFGNNTFPLSRERYPTFETLVKGTTWEYMPQYSLAVDPTEYHDSVHLIDLDESPVEADNILVSYFNEASDFHGQNAVLGILANRADDLDDEYMHNIAKREAKGETDDDMHSTTTAQTPIEKEETDKSFIYLANDMKAILYVTAAPIIYIADKLNETKLVEHTKDITFDDQRAKGYGRLNIIFPLDVGKLFLRFIFTLNRGTWSMKEVIVEFKENKFILAVVGTEYTIPSAPEGFSYRCSSRELLFRNGTDKLIIADYQVQPWLNGSPRFGDVYDCVGFTTAPIWAGVLVSLFLCGILSIGILALMDIKAPNRFESTRNKPLSFFVQE